MTDILFLDQISTTASDSLERAVRYTRMSNELQFQVRPHYTHTHTPDDELKAKCILVTVKVLNQLAEEEWKRALAEQADLMELVKARSLSISPPPSSGAAPSAGQQPELSAIIKEESSSSPTSSPSSTRSVTKSS